MPIDFRNTNTVWASVLAETLQRLGLTTAVICPGSRSAPLAIAFAQHPKIDAIPVLDERSAAFFALGLARRTHKPVALICTSGTAGANFYPAIIEASESCVPLLVLTADRPPELRDCNAGQTIDQQKLFGSYPKAYAELALPSIDLPMLAYLRQTLMQSWQRSLGSSPGVVHLNIPFRDPLVPLLQSDAQALEADFDAETFFGHVHPPVAVFPSTSVCPFPLNAHGIIIAGCAQPKSPERYCRAIAHLSKLLGMPVLAEGLSPLRNYASLNPYLISTYDLILRNHHLAQKLAPDLVIRVGEMPTSRELRQWLAETQPRQWVIDPSDRNLDPLHGKTTHLQTSVESFAETLGFLHESLEAPLAPQFWGEPESKFPTSGGFRGLSQIHAKSLLPAETRSPSPYLELWQTADSKIRHAIDQTMTIEETLFEGKAAWLLSQSLPVGTPFFISTSMPVRDVEFFWKPRDSAVQPFFNRGTNGIDGTLSTALGVAHRHQSSVLLTGDLALLHDTNGFLLRNHFVGHLTIVLINNNGGGIFGMLPIAQFNPPFEEFFATPQNISFADLCQTYQVEYEQIHTWSQLVKRLNPLPSQGIRVLELQTDRAADAQWRHNHLGSFAQSISP